MSKQTLFLICITFLLMNPIYSDEYSDEYAKDPTWNTGKDDLRHLKGTNSNFKKAKDAIKQAKRYAKKGRANKAKKRFNDVIKFLALANKENPNQPDILNLLGYSFKEVGDFAMAEIYYEQGLTTNLQHIGINEYLGELYVETNRIDKAKERLAVLENCNCEEYAELKGIIEGAKKSKY